MQTSINNTYESINDTHDDDDLPKGRLSKIQFFKAQAILNYFIMREAHAKSELSRFCMMLERDFDTEGQMNLCETMDLPQRRWLIDEMAAIGHDLDDPCHELANAWSSLSKDAQDAETSAALSWMQMIGHAFLAGSH
jgi:hypothetical protein